MPALGCASKTMTEDNSLFTELDRCDKARIWSSSSYIVSKSSGVLSWLLHIRSITPPKTNQPLTYGFLNIILNIASGPRWINVPRESWICSSAVATSSKGGSWVGPSSSCQKRYRKHLSLNGCSLLTRQDTQQYYFQKKV